MASCIHQFGNSLPARGVIQMVESSGGYGLGEQRRGFIHVGDVVKINLFFGTGPVRKEIFNVGTGESRTFNDIGQALIRANGGGRIDYVPFPAGLKEKYQNHTQANLQRLRNEGYDGKFVSLEEGIQLSALPALSAAGNFQ